MVTLAEELMVARLVKAATEGVKLEKGASGCASPLRKQLHFAYGAKLRYTAD